MGSVYVDKDHQGNRILNADLTQIPPAFLHPDVLAVGEVVAGTGVTVTNHPDGKVEIASTGGGATGGTTPTSYRHTFSVTDPTTQVPVMIQHNLGAETVSVTVALLGSPSIPVRGEVLFVDENRLSVLLTGESIGDYEALVIAGGGTVGPAGPTGPAGGPTGPRGATGPAGVAGVAGPTGPSGATGIAGTVGPSGPTGATGPQGLMGEAGPLGPLGETGPQGVQGLQGSQGVQGLTGPTGSAGATGPQGTSVKVIGSVPDVGALPPSANIGDGYVDTSDDNLHMWDGTQWVNLGSIVGPAGPQGNIGPQGPQGIEGPQGVQGLPGVTGATGAAGPNAVSTNSGNTASIGTDGLIFVPLTGFDQIAADNRYVQDTGDTMTGGLRVPILMMNLDGIVSWDDETSSVKHFIGTSSLSPYELEISISGTLNLSTIRSRSIAPITMDAHAITNLADGANATDAVTKQQLDAGDPTKLPLAGGTLTGFVAAHADPASPLHVATKSYVDTRVVFSATEPAAKTVGMIWLQIP